MRFKMIRKIFFILLLIILIGIVAIYLFMQTKPFGKLPEGERLIRIEQSPHYKQGEFVNLTPTTLETGDKSRWRVMYEFLFDHVDRLKPNKPLPHVQSDLKNIPIDRNFFVWFGHSSYLLQVDGTRFLVDPVFVSGAPLPFFNDMFEGSNVYRPEDMPDIDYLVITHDHWDHLDYETIKQLIPKVKKVITALGVGSHLEYWGFAPEQITELDWNEEAEFDDVFITALPARHFSGRTLTANKTLWASFMIETSNETVYIGGDSGYDTFYQDIAKRFQPISLAILENGQYNSQWAQIHIQPDELVQAIKDLHPQKVVSVHNAKFALAKHAWDDPMIRLSAAAERENLPLYTPMIGEVFYFTEGQQQFGKWWETVDDTSSQ